MISEEKKMQFEKLYQELANSAAMIQSLLTGVTTAEARSKPDPESWSILEVVCHLYDEECEDFRQRLDITLHRPHEPWPPIDPQGWVSERKYNERDLPEMIARFEAERTRSLDWLKGLAEANWESEYKAPFGPIKAGDILAAWAAHDNLHMRQLVELRRSRLLHITEPYDVRYAGEW